MLEIRSILAPTDFSRHSEVALRYACMLAQRLDSALHLIHVLPDVMPMGPEPMLISVPPPEFYAQNEAESRKALERLLDPAWGTPRAVEMAVRWGDPVEAIVAYSKEQLIDLIVIATHGRTGLSHVLLGSVAERIVRTSPCPVLSVRSPG
jgi:nucleotide-binding universal stress UspA family protein